jgi:hypothetical protein
MVLSDSAMVLVLLSTTGFGQDGQPKVQLQLGQVL